ncbi:MAG: TIGR02996 domain-containing protein [Archangium sp.]
MSDVLLELSRAAGAASASERLAALCRAWALAPSKRIAELAVTVRAAPVSGANQEEREAAWQLLAARATVDDIPTLLATPWSKKPKDAANRLMFFERFGPDPRVARALLELDTGNRYSSAAGHQFWRAAYSLLLRWGSAEAAARIPRDARAFPDSSPWSGQRFIAIFEPLVVEWTGRWPAEPSLSEEAVKVLERMESQRAPHRRLQRELLDAVYERPDDDTARLVFADALTEQGDPRGEFIALQFVHARGELMMGEREHMERVLRANGRGWLDGLDAQVAPLSVFHKGFAEEVRMATRAPDPGAAPWRVVTSLDAAAIATTLSDFFRHPNTARVKTLRSLRGATLQELARNGPSRHFELLEVGFLGGREYPTPAWTVETLRLLAPIDESAWWLVGSSGRIKAKRVELQITGSFERVGAVLREIETRAPDVESVTFGCRTAGWPQPWLGTWQLAFVRVDGRFTHANVLLVHATYDGLLEALNTVDVASIAVHSVVRRGPAWREEVQASIAKLGAAKSQVDLMTPRRGPPSPTTFDGT